MLSNKDANVIFMMQMSCVGMKLQSLFMMLVRIFIPWCKCLLVGMQWCKWSNSNTNYLKNSPYFQIKASLVPEPKIFSKLDLLFLKCHLFDLRLPKKLVIWWSGSKDLFSQFGWARRWHVSKAFLWKNEFFENQVS